MDEFEKSEWKTKESAKEFIENADMYILERKRLFKIIKSVYKHFLMKIIENRPIKVMDLGCGDGRITQELLNIDENLEGTLVDGSAEMLENARKRLKPYSELNYIKTTFQELINKNKISLNFDFIASSLAIHHLPGDEKRTLFKYIYDHLNPGGFFFKY